MDLVLSSGFLAFARHAGFLRAVEQLELPVEGLCGTSSGALSGALWAAAVVRSPPSGASFFSLGDTRAQFDETHRRALAALEGPRDPVA